MKNTFPFCDRLYDERCQLAQPPDSGFLPDCCWILMKFYRNSLKTRFQSKKSSFKRFKMKTFVSKFWWIECCMIGRPPSSLERYPLTQLLSIKQANSLTRLERIAKQYKKQETKQWKKRDMNLDRSQFQFWIRCLSRFHFRFRVCQCEDWKITRPWRHSSLEWYFSQEARDVLVRLPPR